MVDKKKIEQAAAARKKIEDAKLVLWRTRLEALAESGDTERALGFLGSSTDPVPSTNECTNNAPGCGGDTNNVAGCGAPAPETTLSSLPPPPNGGSDLPDVND